MSTGRLLGSGVSYVLTQLSPMSWDQATAITSGVHGHAEIVLFDACRAGVLTARDVDVIGATRVGGQALRAYAAEVGDVYGNVRVRRFRAERRLLAWLESQIGM